MKYAVLFVLLMNPVLAFSRVEQKPISTKQLIQKYLTGKTDRYYWENQKTLKNYRDQLAQRACQKDAEAENFIVAVTPDPLIRISVVVDKYFLEYELGKLLKAVEPCLSTNLRLRYAFKKGVKIDPSLDVKIFDADENYYGSRRSILAISLLATAKSEAQLKEIVEQILVSDLNFSDTELHPLLIAKIRGSSINVDDVLKQRLIATNFDDVYVKLVGASQTAHTWDSWYEEQTKLNVTNNEMLGYLLSRGQLKAARFHAESRLANVKLNPENRIDVIGFLGRNFGDTRTVTRLANLISREQDPNVRTAAVMELGGISMNIWKKEGDYTTEQINTYASSLRVLGNLYIQSSNPNIRITSAQALATVNNRDAYKILDQGYRYQHDLKVRRDVEGLLAAGKDLKSSEPTELGSLAGLTPPQTLWRR